MLRLCHFLTLLFCITFLYANDDDSLAIISSGSFSLSSEDSQESRALAANDSSAVTPEKVEENENSEVTPADSTKSESDSTSSDAAPSVTEIDSSITETDSSITETDSSITETDSSITETDSSITETDSSITETDSSITETDSSITEVAQTISDPADSTTVQTAQPEPDSAAAENSGEPEQLPSALIENENIDADTLHIIEREDKQYIDNILKSDSDRKDSLLLIRKIADDESTYFYEILRNGKSEWELTLQTPANDLEELFVKRDHNNKLKSNTIVADSLEKGSYRVSPWVNIPSIFKEERDSLRLQKFFTWKSGGEVNFSRNHHYNFYGPEGDTSEPFIDLAKPALYDYKLKMSYTHQHKKIWFGGGIERSYQKSHYFDTLSVDRGRWFSRMGWNLHFAVPGFRYEIYRDPGLIPFYGQYEDSIYTKLNRDSDYEFLKRLNLSEYDSTLQLVESPTIPGKLDSNWVTTEIAPLGGVAHKFTLKAGYFKYSVMIHPRAYKRPIQLIEMDDMPFFKGEWNVAMTFLPNRQVIPHAEFDFYRTTIPLKNSTLGISPFHFEIEVWDRLSFYMSIGFNAEFLTKKPAATDKE